MSRLFLFLLTFLTWFADGSNVFDVSSSSRSLVHLFTKIRDKKTGTEDFRRFSRRIMNLVVEEGLSCLAPQETEVTTPTNANIKGIQIDDSDVVG